MISGETTETGAETTTARPTEVPVESIRGATTVASDLAAIAAGRMGVALLSLVGVIFTTRLLGPSGYATVAIVGIISTLVFTVSTAWTSTSVRRYGREDLELRGNLSRLTWNRAIIGVPLFVVALLVVIGLQLFGALPGGLSWPLVGIAVAGAATNIVVDHWACLLETSGRMRTSAAAQVLSQGIYVAALVTLFQSRAHVSPSVVLLLSLGGGLIVSIVVTPIVWRIGVTPIDADRQLLRRMLWLSTPLIGLMASQYVFSSVDLVVLRIFRTQHDVGVYAVAYQAYTVLSGVAVTATTVCVPLFVSLQMAGRRALIDRYLSDAVPQGLFLVSAIGGLTVPLAPIAVRAVFGSAFEAAATPLAILVIGLVFLFATYLVAPVLTLHEQTRATAAINALAAVLNLVGDVVMIAVFHMGIVAPAIATSAALVFMFAAFRTHARTTLAIRARLPVAVVAPLPAGLIPTLAMHGLARTILGIAASATASAAVLAWRSPFRPEDVDLISKLQLPEPVRRAAVKMVRFVT